ncbi:OmpA family protein [Sulfurimonas sp.]
MIIRKNIIQILLLFSLAITLSLSASQNDDIVKVDSKILNLGDITFNKNDLDSVYETKAAPFVDKVYEYSNKYDKYFLELIGDTSCGDVYEQYASKLEDAFLKEGIKPQNLKRVYYRLKDKSEGCRLSRSVKVQLHLSHLINNDLDGDGVVNSLDKCPNTPKNSSVAEDGCVYSTTVILLNGRKKHTAIVVTTSKGSVIINKPLLSVTLSTDAKISPLKKVTPSEVNRLTNGLLTEAKTSKQYHYTLYFNSLKFDKKSKNTLKKLMATLAKLKNPYINIVGHTDTYANSTFNYKLGLKRAQKVAKIIKSAGIKYLKLDLSSRSENDLAVKTPDNTKEALNRRVEIFIQ